MAVGEQAPIRVVLFKTLVSDDPFQSTLLDAGYDPTVVSVLKETYHVDELVDVLTGSEEWEGVIVSSKRGAEGWVRAVQTILQRDGEPSASSSSSQTAWSQIPLWSVGQASLNVLADAKSTLGPRPNSYMPKFDADGSTRTAKSASLLVPLLLADPPMNKLEKRYRPYLVIRGDKSLEDIPRAIKNSQREQRSITVYATAPRQDLATSVQNVVQGIRQQKPPRIWLAFFSPSSASFVLPYIPLDILSHKDTKIFAIGETTRTYLEQERSITVHAVADDPTALGMLNAIRSQ